MGENSTDPRVFDGFKWRNGRNPETQGIVMWSEIFTHDFTNGDKVAIILLDTQGIFDSQTSEKQSTTIIAMSTLISSVQIYNVMQNVQEDDLQHLLYFTEYARLANGQSKNKPFQKLLFLVRDWPQGDSDGYGSQNGDRIINQTLTENDKQSMEMRTRRTQIISSFEEIGAFLIPSPGPNVTRDFFQGDLHQIEKEFLKYAKELTVELFSPEKLLRKEINHQNVSIENWTDYLYEYANVFRGDSLPKPESVVQVKGD